MKKQEFDLIEVYVYANHIQGLSTCVCLQNYADNKYVSDFGEFTENLSKKLLISCEKKIKRKKLNTLSFLVLKKELSSIKFYTNREKNLLTLCEMIKKYNFYENILINL